MNNTLVVPEHFTAAALSHAFVGRAVTVDLHNPTAPEDPAVGHLTVAVTAKDGEPLSTEDMGVLHQDFVRQALASLTIHIVAPTYTMVDVSVTVLPRTGFTADEVKVAVEDAIRAWINPATWDWSSTVDQFALIGVIHDVPGVRQITSVSDTLPLAGKVPLPRLGTVVVTAA